MEAEMRKNHLAASVLAALESGHGYAIIEAIGARGSGTFKLIRAATAWGLSI
jgi:hypothetical protein